MKIFLSWFPLQNHTVHLLRSPQDNELGANLEAANLTDFQEMVLFLTSHQRQDRVHWRQHTKEDI